MKNTMFALLALIGFMFACERASRNDTASSTSQLCGAEPTPNGDGTATSYGCSFENQVHNMMKNGSMLSANGAALSDAHGPVAGTVSHSCGAFLLGADSAGVSFIVNRETGEVSDHAGAHLGQPATNLPSKLAIPLTVSEH